MTLKFRKTAFALQETDDKNIMNLISVIDKDNKDVMGKVVKQYDGTIFIEKYQLDDNGIITVPIHPKYENGEPVKTFTGALAYLEYDSEQKMEVTVEVVKQAFDDYKE